MPNACTKTSLRSDSINLPMDITIDQIHRIEYIIYDIKIGSLGSVCRRNNHPNSSFSIQKNRLTKKNESFIYGLMNSYSRYRTSSSHFPLELCDDEAVATIMFLATRSRGLLRCSVPLILMKQSGMESLCEGPILH